MMGWGEGEGEVERDWERQGEARSCVLECTARKQCLLSLMTLVYWSPLFTVSVTLVFWGAL